MLTWLPPFIAAVISTVGGVGLYRLLRFQRRETAQQIATADAINQSFMRLLGQHERDYDRVVLQRDQAIAANERLLRELRECRDAFRDAARQSHG